MFARRLQEAHCGLDCSAKTRKLIGWGVTLIGLLCATATPALAQNSWSVSTNGNLLQVGYGSNGSWPLYAVFYLNSSYYRLNPGPGSGWGTSMILQPCYWSKGVLYQGGPMTGTWQTVSQNLQLNFAGTVGALSTNSTVTLSPPTAGGITAAVQVSVTGTVQLDNRPGEAFKPVCFSSMYDSNNYFDSWRVITDSGPIYYNPAGGWIFNQTGTHNITVQGGSSIDWTPHTPTMTAALNGSYPAAGWLTSDTNPNDDNVLVWSSSTTVLSNWSYSVTASPT